MPLQDILLQIITNRNIVVRLIWKPLNVFISESADLAYTYGTYTLTIKNDTSETKGTYVSIWKKQENGTWKWVLDTGNEGLEKITIKEKI